MNSTGPEFMRNNIRLEIDLDKMRQLIQKHQLCANDFRCIDSRSKKSIRELFLQACSRPFAESKPAGDE
ncbi:MAG: hypothetical protein ACRESZ_05880 [Methylococcales bacterium]